MTKEVGGETTLSRSREISKEKRHKQKEQRRNSSWRDQILRNRNKKLKEERQKIRMIDKMQTEEKSQSEGGEKKSSRRRDKKQERQ